MTNRESETIAQAHAILTGAARASDYRDVAEAYLELVGLLATDDPLRRALTDLAAMRATPTAAQKPATEERDRRMRDEVQRVAAERVVECALRLASDLAAGGGSSHTPNAANAATESPQDAPVGSGPLPPMPREVSGGQKGACHGSPNWPDLVAVELGRGGR